LKKKNATIGLDVQGFIRIAAPDGSLQHREWPEERAVLSMVDILKADAVEARFLTGESDIGAAARTLAARGPSEIVLTHRDGLLVLADGVVYETEFHPENLIGRSGRGDTCLGSYVARRLESPPAEAILWAAAVTSLKMEAEGPFHREIGDVVHLLQEKYAVPAEV
jgi:sugar/nucleoside kinase (ribokinase family)